MTRTGPADAVMSACARTAPDWSASVRPVSRGPASGKSASCRAAGRSCRLRPVRPPLRRQRARAPCPPCPPRPVLVHPLYLYLLPCHAATQFGWSSDPGRDVLCLLISPLRWLQWP